MRTTRSGRKLAGGKLREIVVTRLEHSHMVINNIDRLAQDDSDHIRSQGYTLKQGDGSQYLIFSRRSKRTTVVDLREQRNHKYL